jgi:hypothetical protein
MGNTWERRCPRLIFHLEIAPSMQINYRLEFSLNFLLVGEKLLHSTLPGFCNRTSKYKEMIWMFPETSRNSLYSVSARISTKSAEDWIQQTIDSYQHWIAKGKQPILAASEISSKFLILKGWRIPTL